MSDLPKLMVPCHVCARLYPAGERCVNSACPASPSWSPVRSSAAPPALDTGLHVREVTVAGEGRDRGSERTRKAARRARREARRLNRAKEKR